MEPNVSLILEESPALMHPMRRAHLCNRVRRPGASSTRGVGRVGSVGPADDRTFLEFVAAAVRTVAKRPAQRVNIWSLSAVWRYAIQHKLCEWSV